MKNFFLAVFLLSGLFCFSQHNFITVDRSAVEKAVTDSSAPTYYPKLLQRFTSFDTTLTAVDYRLLYYGFAFQKTYNGYMDHRARDINKALSENKFDEAIKICDEVLQKSPISLEANYKKGLAMFQKNEKDPSYLVYGIRYKNLRDAIIESGDGLTCKTAFKILYVHDEYNLMYQFFQIKGVKSQALQGFCDVMQVTPSEYFKASSIYFDTYESLASMERMFKSKQ